MSEKTNFNNNEKMHIKTLYGEVELEQPFIDLIKTPTMQRLKNLTMGGVYKYSKDNTYKDYSRYEHSIGVFMLLKHFGASIKEQIAGLLHDASHTAFSHVGDVVFGNKSHKDSYQDKIHKWFLKEQKIDLILKKYNLSLEDILHKSGRHKILEQDLPNICADRLDSNLSIGKLNMSSISPKSVIQILNDLKFENETFFFSNLEIAKKFANISLYCTPKYWGNEKTILLYQWLAQALKRAVDINLITHNDIHFSTDDVLWDKLKTSNDEKILEFIEKIINHNDCFKIGNKQNYDQILHGKFRVIDPFIKINNKLKRLSCLDPKFSKEFNTVKNIMEKGYYIKFT